MSEWPELEPCACGEIARPGQIGGNAGGMAVYYSVSCFGIGCQRNVRSQFRTEAAAAWNALQRVAKGEKEPHDAHRR